MKNIFNFNKNNHSEFEDDYLLSISKRGDESYEYLQSVLKGFAWIFMLLISFFSTFLIFDTPYYKYYEKTEPFLLKELEDKELVEKVIDEKTLFSERSSLLELDDVKEEKPVENIQKQLETDLSKQAQPLNKKDSKITSLLKETIPAKEVTTDKVKPPATIWLVNIFSTTNKNNLQARLSEYEASRPELFEDVNIYFSEFIIGATRNYRISLGYKVPHAEYGYFEDKESAATFCSSLKRKSVDCFVTSLDSRNLKKYFFK